MFNVGDGGRPGALRQLLLLLLRLLGALRQLLLLLLLLGTLRLLLLLRIGQVLQRRLQLRNKGLRLWGLRGRPLLLLRLRRNVLARRAVRAEPLVNSLVDATLPAPARRAVAQPPARARASPLGRLLVFPRLPVRLVKVAVVLAAKVDDRVALLKDGDAGMRGGGGRGKVQSRAV